MLTKLGAPCVYAVGVPDPFSSPIHPGPVPIGWEEAPRVLRERLAAEEPPSVLCIAGAVGSGKSTLAHRLAADGDAVVLATDDYLPDYDRVPEHLRDEPDAAHLPELAAHLDELRFGREVSAPVWSFHEHRRVRTRPVRPAGLIVVEGIHALHATLSGVRSLGVLVEAPAAVRWARWEVLESSGERGWGVEKARAFFETVAEPTFDRHRPAYLARADYIVANDTPLPPAGVTPPGAG